MQLENNERGTVEILKFGLLIKLILDWLLVRNWRGIKVYYPKHKNSTPREGQIWNFSTISF